MDTLWKEEMNRLLADIRSTTCLSYLELYDIDIKEVEALALAVVRVERVLLQMVLSVPQVVAILTEGCKDSSRLRHLTLVPNTLNSEQRLRAVQRSGFCGL